MKTGVDHLRIGGLWRQHHSPSCKWRHRAHLLRSCNWRREQTGWLRDNRWHPCNIRIYCSPGRKSSLRIQESRASRPEQVSCPSTFCVLPSTFCVLPLYLLRAPPPPPDGLDDLEGEAEDLDPDDPPDGEEGRHLVEFCSINPDLISLTCPCLPLS